MYFNRSPRVSVRIPVGVLPLLETPLFSMIVLTVLAPTMLVCYRATIERRKKASAESSAGPACLNQAANVVFALVWAVRLVFAAWERWHLASPPEEPVVVRSPVPEERDAARSLLPGVRAAIHERSSQLAH